MRLNISLDEGIAATAKKFAESKKLPFSSLIAIALERHLKAEGFVDEDESSILEKAVSEARANGVTFEDIMEKLTELGTERICNG